VTNNPLLNPASPKQGYQQISATYGVILGKANGKANNNSKEKTNNKGNKANNGNKGKSGGSGGGNRKEQTTQSSIIQTTTSKNKYYRISQQQQQKNNKQDRNGVQTQRPKANSGEKSYDEKSRKVVGEITTTNGSNGSIKAAKQVKESTTSSSSSNSRIPKLFERYEKIQAIFPELEPYENSSPKGKAKQAKQGKQFEVELFRPTTGGNSRQGNTKKSPSVPPPSQTMATLSILPILPAGGSSFLPDQKILKKQQLLMAAAGVMAPAQVEVEMEEVQATPDYEEPRDHRKEVNGPNGSQSIFRNFIF